MMTSTTKSVLPEYVAEHLGAPFQVVLCNSVRQEIDAKGEIVKTTIPNPRGLLRQVAITRLIHPRKLSGRDIKFVRKALSIKAKELADMISVSAEHLSRCETEKAVLSPGIEKFLRLSVLVDTLKLPEGIEQDCEENEAAMRRLSKFRKSFERLQDSIRSMQIEAVYNTEEPLSLHFFVSERSAAGYDDDLGDEDWYDDIDLAA